MKQGLEAKLGPKDRVTLGISLITYTKLLGLFAMDTLEFPNVSFKCTIV